MLLCYIADVIYTCRGVVVDYKVGMDTNFRIKPECWGTSFGSGLESVMWGTLGENR